MKKSVYNGLTERTRRLLDGAENLFVDFKREIEGVHPATFVAFANASGGTILVGVEEAKRRNGMQYGRIYGVEPTDGNKLRLVSMASSCRPGVKIEIFIENLSDKPIFRIEVPEGENKPYCTASGEYKIRDDGGNRGITPQEMVGIILERQQSQVARIVGRLETIELKLEEFGKILDRITKKSTEERWNP
ncbi:MAG: ATP-binding protein [Armatimonadetes bacterium]|nr:ATP-binding protein [Armatimonadota bacterium]